MGQRSHHLLVPIDLCFPFWEYFELFRGEPHAFLLDSALEAHELSRFSYMGGAPSSILRAKRVVGSEGPSVRTVLERFTDSAGGRLRSPVLELARKDPFALLREIQEERRAERADAQGCPAPFPFLSGAVGFLSYEAAGLIEALPRQAEDDLGLPDLCFVFMDRVLAHDHHSGGSVLSIVGHGPTPESAREEAESSAMEMLGRIRAFEAAFPSRLPSPAPASRRSEESPRGDRGDYLRKVEQARQHILCGDAFEICLSRRVELEVPGLDPWLLYRELRRINPAPYAAYLQFPGAAIVSASPERFLSLDRAGLAETRPIKGTRRRGANVEEDQRLMEELRSSEKDRAENLMIVDLLRNDLGRVSAFGSVRATKLLCLEAHPSVFQLVSVIQGRLAAGRDGLDLIRACFPGGSMTGAPKIEALGILDRLEGRVRGVYSGALGFLDDRGGLELSIVIRTILVQGSTCSFGVGGAVVADSVPELEYQETVDKAQPLLGAILNITSPCAAKSLRLVEGSGGAP